MANTQDNSNSSQNQPQSPSNVTLQFTPDSMQDLQELSKNLQTSTASVVGQALALLKVAQGRQIFLKRGSENLKIDKYANQPAQIDKNEKS
jgi:hypothetical protein